MNNETKIGLVKEWGSPRSNVQLFMPQEYCDACTYESVTSLPDWIQRQYQSGGKWYDADYYIDLDGDKVYDLGERFKLDGTRRSGLSVDVVTENSVNIYYITMSNGTINAHSLSVGDSYVSSVSNGTTYKGHSIAFVKVKVLNNSAYYYTRTQS